MHCKSLTAGEFNNPDSSWLILSVPGWIPFSVTYPISRQAFENYLLNSLCHSTPQAGNKGQDWLLQKIRKCFNDEPILQPTVIICRSWHLLDLPQIPWIQGRDCGESVSLRTAKGLLLLLIYLTPPAWPQKLFISSSHFPPLKYSQASRNKH